MNEVDRKTPSQHADAVFDRAIRLHRENRLEDAARAYEEVLGCDGDHLQSLYHLALVRGAQGRLDDGLFFARRCVALRPDSSKAQAQAGGLLSALGRPHEALPFLERARDLDPLRADVLNNLGAALRSTGRIDEALTFYEKALAIAPDYHDARYNFAAALASREKYSQAIEQYEMLLAQQPTAAEVHSAYGKALWKANRLDDAIAALRSAMELYPNLAEPYAHYGNALTEHGRLAEARPAFERAIQLAPTLNFLIDFWPRKPTQAATPAHLDVLAAIVADPADSDDQHIEADFALSRVYAKQGDRPRSFRHLQSANARRRFFIEYDEAETLESFNRIAEVFTSGFLESRRGCSDPSALPVFIFGMPRSGTTLIEQIRHAAVYGGGELTFFEDFTKDVLASGKQLSPRAMLAAGCDSLREIGRRYAAALKDLAGDGAERITDKMPGNFRFAGTIHTVLPNARMIHARRIPCRHVPVVLFALFCGEQPFAYDLAELGRYYRGYRRLMDHWRATLPASALLEVQYEDVVEDVTAQARRIIEFCGLPWDPAAPRIYTLKRPVRTASATQVRQPIYRTSVRYSRDYGDLLRPLLDELEAIL